MMPHISYVTDTAAAHVRRLQRQCTVRIDVRIGWVRIMWAPPSAPTVVPSPPPTSPPSVPLPLASNPAPARAAAPHQKLRTPLVTPAWPTKSYKRQGARIYQVHMVQSRCHIHGHTPNQCRSANCVHGSADVRSERMQSLNVASSLMATSQPALPPRQMGCCVHISCHLVSRPFTRRIVLHPLPLPRPPSLPPTPEDLDLCEYRGCITNLHTCTHAFLSVPLHVQRWVQCGSCAASRRSHGSSRRLCSQPPPPPSPPSPSRPSLPQCKAPLVGTAVA